MTSLTRKHLCRALQPSYLHATLVTLTYMHLRVKFLCRGPGEIGPSDIVFSKVVGAVWGVPHVVAVGPGQDAGEGRVEVEKGPGDDGVVVEGHVQRNNTYCVSNSWNR